jgi:hypothetical protein
VALKNVSGTREKLKSLDDQLNMGCEGEKRCVGGLKVVPRFYFGTLDAW